MTVSALLAVFWVDLGVPFAFLLLFIAELNGAPTALVHGAFTTLFAARVLHGNFGIQTDNAAGAGRAIGALTTLLVSFGAGVYNVSLRLCCESATD